MGSAHVIIKNKWRRACASATIYGPVNIKAMISRLSQSRGAARSARSEGRHKQREQRPAAARKQHARKATAGAGTSTTAHCDGILKSKWHSSNPFFCSFFKN